MLLFQGRSVGLAKILVDPRDRLGLVGPESEYEG